MVKYLTASEIIERANRIIPLESQKSTVLDIASVLSLHLKRLKAIELGMEVDDLPVISQLIVASTGSGKTYLISQLAKAAGLGFYTIDASSITPAGYKGTNINQAIYSAQTGAESARKFETGIILFDEFDKLAQNRFGHANEFSPQSNFLTVLEGRTVTHADQNGEIHTIDLSKMLFLFSGAFQGLDEVVKKRVYKKNRIGFSSLDKNDELDSNQLLSQATMEDIAEYGFNREILGRIGSIHYIPPLDRQDYVVLLREGEHSVQGKYSKLLSCDRVNFTITDDACDVIANRANEKNLGARAANSIVMEKVLEAVSKVDEDEMISEVKLHANQEELVLEYSHDENMLEAFTEKQREINIALYMETERGMNHLCMKMMASFPRSEENLESEIITFYFLQIALRFLKLHTKKEDWTLSSIMKMARTTSRGDEEFGSMGERTTFDILIDDYIEEQEDADVYNFDFLLLKYLYKRYKALETANSAIQIVNSIDKMHDAWITA